MQIPEYIYHILTEHDWQAARAEGVYIPGGYGQDGFIHFSFAEQVADTANRYYRDVQDLVVLKVDTGKVGGEIRLEPAPGGELFPHLYAVLNLDAVVDILPLIHGDDGNYKFTQ